MTDIDRRRVLALGVLTAAAVAAEQPAAGAGTDGSDAPAVLRTRDGVVLRRVAFRAPDGVRLVGHLRTPAGSRRPGPAVVLANAMTSVKEQSVQTGYAHGLARAGIVTLTFDQRRFGQSGGHPRQHEDNEERLADLHVAVSHLRGLSAHVDPDRIGALGVSIGGGLAMKLTAQDPRVRAFVAIAAGLHDPQRIRELQGPDNYATALTAQTAALERYHRTGQLEYIPVARTPGMPLSQPVLFDSRDAVEYYGSPRGGIPAWENRATVLSLRTILVHDVRHPVDLVGPRAGMLVVGEFDESTLPEDHRAVYDRLTGPRRLVVVEGAAHNDLYDRPRYVGQVVAEAVRWFTTHLG